MNTTINNSFDTIASPRETWKIAYRTFRKAHRIPFLNKDGSCNPAADEMRTLACSLIRTLTNRWDLPRLTVMSNLNGPRYIRQSDGGIRKAYGLAYLPTAAFTRWMRRSDEKEFAATRHLKADPESLKADRGRLNDTLCLDH